MKKTLYILLAFMGITLTGCQDTDDPTPLSPTLTTPTVLEVGINYASFDYIECDGYYTDCYYYVSSNYDMTDMEQVSEKSTLRELNHTSTYYYMACVTDGINEVYGDIKSFTTLVAYTISIASVDSLGVENDANKFSSSNEEANNLGIVAYREEPDGIIRNDIGVGGSLMASRSWTSGGNEEWSLDYEVTIDEDEYYTLYAFYPYASNIYSNYELELPVYIENTHSVAWGESSLITQDSPSATIEMDERLATVVIQLTCEGLEVESMKFVDDLVLPGYGYLDVTTGSFLYPNDANLYYPKTNLISGSTSFSDYQECAFRLFPCSFEDGVELYIYLTNGKSYYTTFEETTWKSGSIYIYTATIVDDNLLLELSSELMINDWEDGGSTEIDFEISE